MKKFVLSVILVGVTALGLNADPAAQAIGYWKSISDVKTEVGKVTALWQLSLDAQGRLQGASKKAEFNGLPVRGTYWMKGLKKSGSEGWSGGTIVDIGEPKGEVYGCDVKVTNGGKKLAMRGYMGFALLGRTQTWEAATEEEATKLIGP